MRGFTVPTVYFQKYVAIQNPRLWGLYCCIYITLVALVAAAIALFQVYLVPVEPHCRLQLWSNVGTLTGSSCPTGSYDYDPGNGTGHWSFQGAGCATMCSNGLPDLGMGACVSTGQLVKQDGDSLFFATAFNEEVNLRYHNDQNWMVNYFDQWLLERGTSNNTVPGSPCPFPVSSSDSEARQCKKKASYLIPSTWHQAMSAQFVMEYQVRVPDSFAHAMSGKQLMETTGMTTVIKSSTGGQFREIAAGQVVSISVQDALTAAGLDLSQSIPEQADLPNNQQRAKIQAVGATLVFHMEVTNNGDMGTPVNEITIQGIPGFATQKETDVLDPFGSVRVRTYSGIRFVFSSRGSFTWFRFDKFVYVFTMCVVWLQLPGMIFFSFAIRGLGTLSEALAGYTYEHIDFTKEVIGVSARNMAYSFSQEDTSDLSEESGIGKLVYGMSLRQVRRRLHHVLNGHPTLTGPERKLFTEFFLANATGSLPSGRDALTYEGYLHHLSSNENLRGFQDVVSIIDPAGGNKNALEYVFTDNTVKAMQELANKRRKVGEVGIIHDTKMIVLSRLKLQASIWAAQRCNLTRCQLGQEALEGQLEKLQGAGVTLHEFASRLQSGKTEEE
ncbi:unnamed protein product [Durusdinium trenchii]|uniref:Uncharacterized protein n=1 Tax=Durusdinium trenchii TaxID=1381693 RepID=A0ABP0K4F3_9DINO